MLPKVWRKKLLLTLSEIIEQELPQANVSVLSGPSHAEEVGKGLPTTCVVSSHQRETAEYLQGIFMSPVFRVYTTPDMLGVELGAALKNVIALAAGTADGLGYGDNTKAALITRGIAEISRLGVKMGARMETFYGLSGIGDLIVTCASVHSRNRKAGYLMGKGYTMEQAMAEVKMIVEGVYSAKAAKELEELTGRTYSRIHVVGGGSNAGYLNELTAKATGKEVHAGPGEATAIGNITAQMIKEGEFKSVEEARTTIHESFGIKIFKA